MCISVGDCYKDESCYTLNMTCKGGYNNNNECTSSIACPGGICTPNGICISVPNGHLPCSRCGDCPYGSCVIGLGVCVTTGSPCDSPQDCFNSCNTDLCICSAGSCYINPPNTTIPVPITTSPNIPQTTNPSPFNAPTTLPSQTTQIPTTIIPIVTTILPTTIIPVVTTNPPTTLVPTTIPVVTTQIVTTMPPVITIIPPQTTISQPNISTSQPPQTTKPQIQNCNCSFSYGYWKTHYPASWPPQYVNSTFCNVKWIDIMGMSTQSDAFIILARQLAATYLNTYNCYTIDDIKKKMIDGYSLLIKLCLQNGWNKKYYNHTRDQMITIATTLDNYNNGKISPVIHCS